MSTQNTETTSERKPEDVLSIGGRTSRFILDKQIPVKKNTSVARGVRATGTDTNENVVYVNGDAEPAIPLAAVSRFCISPDGYTDAEFAFIVAQRKLAQKALARK